MTKQLSLPSLFLLLVSFAIYTAQAQGAEKPSYTPYQDLLSRYTQHTDQGHVLVNYSAWEQNPLHQEAMNAITGTDPSSLQGDALMAFWINAYNLLTIDLIIKEKETESIRNLGNLFNSPWKKYSWNINGTTYTLHEIEHEILRPMGDARIHMAINCASLSCPNLAQEVYRANTLDAQLAKQTKNFLQDSNKGLQLDKQNRVLKVSKIFDWFEEDFELNNKYKGEESIKNFIAQYRDDLNFDELKDYKVKYLNYDWSLNDWSLND